MAIEWVRLKLDLDAFDDARFEPYLRRCQQTGIELTTMAAAGDTVEHRHALYNLNKTCSADIPERGVLHVRRVPRSAHRDSDLRSPRRRSRPGRRVVGRYGNHVAPT